MLVPNWPYAVSFTHDYRNWYVSTSGTVWAYGFRDGKYWRERAMIPKFAQRAIKALVSAKTKEPK
jgi:hypothetical protein